MASIVVREIETGKEVRRIPLRSVAERHVEGVMMGLLMNMDTTRFYADDSEADNERASHIPSSSD